jgi:hypothetical protein
LLVFSFDEPGFLIDKGNRTAFSVFRRALKEVFPHCDDHSSAFVCIAVLTDTTSAISNFSPSVENDPSARSFEHGDVDMLEPLYMLRSVPMAPSFDGTLSPKAIRDAVSPRIVLAISRPLFWWPV